MHSDTRSPTAFGCSTAFDVAESRNRGRAGRQVWIEAKRFSGQNRIFLVNVLTFGKCVELMQIFREA